MFLSLFVFNLCRNRTYIDQSSSYQFEFALGPHLYRSAISLSCQFSLSRDRTYINQSSSCQFGLIWVGAAPISIGHVPITFRVQLKSGSHLYRSVIHRVSLSQGRTYINRPCSYHFSCSLCVGTAPISIGHHLISLSLSRGRTYINRSSPCHTSLCFWDCTYIDRSLSCQLEFGVAPISIGHLLVISVCVSGIAPISIGHCLVS